MEKSKVGLQSQKNLNLMLHLLDDTTTTPNNNNNKKE